jgi:hypothetical protein
MIQADQVCRQDVGCAAKAKKRDVAGWPLASASTAERGAIFTSFAYKAEHSPPTALSILLVCPYKAYLTIGLAIVKLITSVSGHPNSAP